MPKVGRIHAALRQEFRLKGQQRNHRVVGRFEDLNPTLLPGPHAGGDQLDHAPLASPGPRGHPLCQSKVESRVVNQHDEVPRLRKDGTGRREVGPNGSCVAQHIPKPHKGKLLEVAKYRFVECTAELGSAPRVNVKLGLNAAKGPNEFRPEDVARGLTRQNKDALHNHSQRQ